MAGYGAFFSYQNFADDATVTSNHTFEATLPLSNLKTPRVAEKARTTALVGAGAGIESITISVVFPQTQLVKVIAFIGLNFYRGGDLANLSQVFGTYYSDAAMTTSLGSFDMTFADLIQSGMPANQFFIANSGAGVSCRAIKFTTVRWGTPDPDTFYEFGRLWIGDAIWLSNGVDNGLTLTMADNSTYSISRDQQTYPDSRPVYRTLKADITQLTKEQCFGDIAAGGGSSNKRHFQEMAFISGKSKDMLFIPYGLNPQEGGTFKNANFMNRTAIYGYLSEDIVIHKMIGDFYETSIKVVEAR